MSEFVSTHPLLTTEEHNLSSSSSSSILKSSNSVELKASTTTNTTTQSNFFTTYPTRRTNSATPTRQPGSSTISNYSTFLTPTTILNSSPRQQTSTDALLFQSLRAGAQELGLESDSLGWAILRHLSLSSARSARALIRRLISSPNPLILVLPQSKQSSVTPETIHDHLLVTCTPESGTGLCSSLSGWRALIEGDRLMVYSPGRPCRSNADLDPNSLVPTVKPSTSLSSELTAPTRLRLPLFSFTSLTSTTLTLPGLTPSRTSTTTQRLASLFGPKFEDNQLSDPTDEPLSISIRVLADHGAELASGPLDEALRDALRNRIRDSLGSLEESVLTKIGGFLDRLSRGGGTGDRSLYLSQPQEVSEALQQLYMTIEADLEKEYLEEPVLVDHTLELVEEVICVELYDRLLTKEEYLSEMISDSNFADISLDQLGLDLDRSEMNDPDRVAIIRTGLDEIIAAATSELARLQDLECRSPRDKLSVCVRVHKLIVDALSVLPPIPLKRDISLDPALTAIEMTAPVTACSTPRMSSASLPTPTPLRPQDPSEASTADLLDALQTELFPSDPSPSSPSPPPTRTPSPLTANVPSSALKTRSSSASSADLILPMLIYLLIHSTQPQDILSHLRYIRRYRHKRFLSGETDYCLVNFEVALAFIRGSNEGPPLGIKKEDQGKRGEGLGAARRLVSDMLAGGYQRVVSAPRTLEDVRRILGSGGSSSEGGTGSNTRWSSILREGTGRFFNKDELSAVSASSKPGLLSSLRRSTLGSSEIEHTALESAHTAGDAKQYQMPQDLANEDGGGPIARFESCNGAEGLVMGDIALLVKDYQRLARIGRRAGIWK